MPLHLLKLCVGADSIGDLDVRIAARAAERRAAGGADEPDHVHVTRMVPTRGAAVLDGGSLYWVIRGQVAARQRVRGIEPFTDAAGIGRCRLMLDRAIVAVEPRPCRPFQGWRYLADGDRPRDLDAATPGADLPEALRFALRELCLL